ncbi:YciI family protein [Devosia sp. ZB163]|uniref:YciI family protein n=1 Tax=Devosia sp. ZB163 TaxID=3025938 RepID=UPI002362F77F|nr:YciI family protein [Devosia sp. ZB163]MDC9826281.1 YciI family protein [Devosia sp. ZB163]
MLKFITIGYGGQQGYDQTDEAVRNTAHAHDAAMQQAGAVMGVAGAPVQVRNPDAHGVVTSPGPYLRADLPIAGFGLIEADSLEEAVEMASKSPCAVAHGVIEVWPLQVSV